MVLATGKYGKRESLGLDGQRFEVEGKLETYRLRTSLLGVHQMENAALAVVVAEGLGIDKTSIERGISNTRSLPGRMEVAKRRPLVILDGAHNRGAMEALKRTIEDIHQKGRRILVIGILRDKAIDDMMKVISPYFDEVYVTKPKNQRAAEPEAILDAVGGASIIENVTDAVGYVIDRARPDDLICVTGSFYTVAEAKEVIM
jgi:dihydrofolate synthase/folylpolyglutamate synthase